MERLRHPTNGVSILPRKLSTEFGVYLKTDGTPQFASQEYVRVWQYAVAKFGLPWAWLRFFDRSEFPQIEPQPDTQTTADSSAFHNKQ